MDHLYDVEGVASPAQRIQGNFEEIDLKLFGGEVAIAASAIDWNLGAVFTKTLAGNVTFTFSNLKNGRSILVLLDGSAGTYTVTWPGGILWPGGTAHSMTATGVDIVRFTRIGGTIYGWVQSNLS